jgi:mono/diheme cytochrome c family protein
VKSTLRLALSVAITASALSVHAGERVGDFALIDHEGAFQHMAWYDDHSAAVIMPFTSTTDLTQFSALQATYADLGVAFFLMNPGMESDRAAVADILASKGVDASVLMDDTQLVTEMLGIQHMDQVVLYDPSNFELLYRGPAGDQLETSIQAAVNGENNDLIEVAASGRAIELINADLHANLSYTQDIAPIIAENCAECHREGGIAPFAMDSNLAVQGWSPMIREVVMTKRMPPGQIDNKVGHKMKNEMNLSDEEMQ